MTRVRPSADAVFRLSERTVEDDRGFLRAGGRPRCVQPEYGIPGCGCRGIKWRDAQSGPNVIVGIGVDLVDIARFERTLERTPRLLERLFSPAEQTRPPRSLAARYAAKEALIKALGGSDGVHWTEIEITPEESGRPWFTLTGSTAAVIADRGITGLHLSMSHDAGFATAFVVAEADAAASVTAHADVAARATTRGMGSYTGRDAEPGPGAGAEPGPGPRAVAEPGAGA
jgi:holo-[acyl-carrier protein] synthase